MGLTLKKQWFNELYFILNDIIKIPTIRKVFIYGGKSSAKTVSICQIIAKECFVSGANALGFRKESVTIPTTLKKSFNLAIDSMYLYPAFERQDRRYLCKNQYNETSELVLRGLDDAEKAKGSEGYKFIFLDELNHFEQAEYEQFDLSLRGIEGQKIFAAWNPVDENSWVKTDLVDKYEWLPTEWKLPCDNSFVNISSDGKAILIKTTYEDNYWIVGSPGYAVDATGKLINGYGYRDQNLIDTYENLRLTNYNSYKVNVLGEWGKTTFGGEILKCWKSEIHTGIHPYNADLAIHLIFDENVNPYFPVGIFQIDENGKDSHMIACVALRNPDNTISAMCRILTRMLRTWGHTEAVFIGGDPTSQKEDVKQEKGHDLFRLIMDGLIEFKPRRATLSGSPSVRMSTDFFNSILESNIMGLSFGVDKSCRVAISDFENTKEDKNGKVDKKTVTDPVTKVSYQPYGHVFDLTRYFLVYTFASEYAEYQRGGPVKISYGRNPVSKNAY